MGSNTGYGFLCLIFSAVLALGSCKEGPLTVMYAEKMSDTILQCPSTASGLHRSWYKGFLNQLAFTKTNITGIREVLFNQTVTGEVVRVTSRGEMTVDSDSFALNINNIGDMDHVFYTCVTYHPAERITFDAVRIKVFDSLGVPVIHAEVRSNASLPCGSTTSGSSRAWYRGSHSEQTILNAYPLFNQSAAGSITNQFSYLGIHIDPASFAIRFTNLSSVLQGYYTCVTIQPSGTTYAVTYLSTYNSIKVIEAEENTTTTIPTIRPIGAYNSQWIHGYLGLIYVMAGISVISTNPRSDMELNATTLDLRIGNVQLEDDTYINVVSQYYPVSLDDITQLKVFIQPKPVITGLENGPFNVGDEVTVVCTVERVYPELPTGFGFHLTWGDTTHLGAKTPNGDGSWKYSTIITKTLTMDEDKSTVSCTISPELGNVTSKVMEVNIQSACFPNPCQNSGTCQVTGSSYTCSCLVQHIGKNCEDECTPNPCQNGGTCTDGDQTHTCTCTSEFTGKNCEAEKGSETGSLLQDNIIPIAAGAAGGAVLLIILIIVIACCCCRRKDKGSMDGSRSEEVRKSEYLNSAFHGETTYQNDSYDSPKKFDDE